MYVIDISTANPPFEVSQNKAAEELKKKINSNAAQRMVDAAAAHSGIDFRYVIVQDTIENQPDKFYLKDGNNIKPDTDIRMREYEKWSKIIARQAVEELLERNHADISKINHLITISCTGFYAPGIDKYLIKEFGLSPSIKRINIGFMGCAASITGFNSALEATTYDGENESFTLLVALEICSIHLQTIATRDNILASMIFADGCGAVLFSNSKMLKDEVKLKLISTDSFLFTDTEKFMGWKIGSYGFDLVLSSDIPKIILDSAAPELVKILSSRGLNPEMVNHWALHPGGRAILDALQTGLSIPEEKMVPSRSILKNYGNMSSASILFVLKEILTTRVIKKDDICCAIAFGPGLVMEVAIFKGI